MCLLVYHHLLPTLHNISSMGAVYTCTPSTSHNDIHLYRVLRLCCSGVYNILTWSLLWGCTEMSSESLTGLEGPLPRWLTHTAASRCWLADHSSSPHVPSPWDCFNVLMAQGTSPRASNPWDHRRKCNAIYDLASEVTHSHFYLFYCSRDSAWEETMERVNTRRQRSLGTTGG